MLEIISYECYDFEGKEGLGKLGDNANVIIGFALPCPSGGSPCFIHRRDLLKSYLFKTVIQHCHSGFRLGFWWTRLSLFQKFHVKIAAFIVFIKQTRCRRKGGSTTAILFYLLYYGPSPKYP